MTIRDPTTEAEAETEAYLTGYRETETFDLMAELQGIPSLDERERHAHEAFHHHQETATWANKTAPYLRQLAGYGDRGYGTYQECPDRETRELFARLVDRYAAGYVDGMLDRDPQVETDE